MSKNLKRMGLDCHYSSETTHKMSLIAKIAIVVCLAGISQAQESPKKLEAPPCNSYRLQKTVSEISEHPEGLLFKQRFCLYAGNLVTGQALFGSAFLGGVAQFRDDPVEWGQGTKDICACCETSPDLKRNLQVSAMRSIRGRVRGETTTAWNGLLAQELSQTLVFRRNKSHQGMESVNASGLASAEGSFKPSRPARVGPIWRISITPRSRAFAIPGPVMKKEDCNSGRSGRYP